MDSMVGYKENGYLYFGKAAARTDDVFNYIPARLSALFMLLASVVLRYRPRNAWKIWRRDRRKHASPNSAQTESCARALWGFGWRGTPSITAFCTKNRTSATRCARSNPSTSCAPTV